MDFNPISDPLPMGDMTPEIMLPLMGTVTRLISRIVRWLAS